jgi:hypothetical protein
MNSSNKIRQKNEHSCSDPQSKELFFFLLQKSSVPYLEMLGQWIYQGLIKDPYGEFLVEEHHDQRKEDLTEELNDNEEYHICKLLLESAFDMDKILGRKIYIK